MFSQCRRSFDANSNGGFTGCRRKNSFDNNNDPSGNTNLKIGYIDYPPYIYRENGNLRGIFKGETSNVRIYHC